MRTTERHAERFDGPRPAPRLGRAGLVAVAIPPALAALLFLAVEDGARSRRPADVILTEFAAVPYPTSVESDSTQVLEAFDEAIRCCTRRANELALELYRTWPQHPEVPRLMASRWWLARRNLEDPGSVLRETAEVLAQEQRDGSGALRSAALYARAFAAIDSGDVPRGEAERLVDEALAARPWPEGSEQPAELLWDLASQRLSTPAGQKRVLERLLREHPTSFFAIDAAREFRVLERVGTALELAFDDAASGLPFDLADLRGREVLVLVMRMSPVFPERRRALAEIARRQHGGDDTPVVVVWRTAAEDARGVAGACTAELGLRCWFFLDPGVDGSGWVDRLMPAVTPLYLLVDAQGRLARISMRLATLLE